MSRILTALSVSLSAVSIVAPARATASMPVAGAIEAVPPSEPAAGRAAAGRESGPPTLLGKKATIGGYGSLDVAYTRMFGQDGALVGVQGALLLDHRIHLGLAGYGWTNPQTGPDDIFGNTRRFQTGYLGGTFRYSFLQNSPVYLTVGALIGGGGVVLAPDRHDDRDDDRNDIDREDVDVFAVFQPDVAVHANVTRWLRLGLTAGYRFTAGVDRFGFDEDDVNGLVAGGHLQFGRF
jgi:hypothetical protein